MCAQSTRDKCLRQFDDLPSGTDPHLRAGNIVQTTGNDRVATTIIHDAQLHDAGRIFLIVKILCLLQAAEEALPNSTLSAKKHIGEAITLARDLGAKAEKVFDSSSMYGGLTPWQVRRVSECIKQRLEFPLRTAQLAKAVNLSTGYFFHAFKKSFGQSPHAYIIYMRVRRAQELMLSSNEPLCRIAVACGLANQSQLTKTFRRLTGLTPSTWRRNRAGALRNRGSSADNRDNGS